MLTFSKSKIHLSGMPKAFTKGFKPVSVETLDDLIGVANRYSISAPSYKDGHRAASNITSGGNLILIDCDLPGQTEAVEAKIQHYDYIKVPSASNSEATPYKWHYFIPVQEPLSIYPAAMKWQVEQFFRQIGIVDDMIDTTGSYDIARQFAPASVKMDAEEADDLSEVNNTGIAAPVMPTSEISVELLTAAAKSKSIKIDGIAATELPAEHLWFQGHAIAYQDAIQAVRGAYEAREEPDDKIIVSGFGCPHNNSNHSGDVKSGYGFAFIGSDGDVIVKCSGNECKDHPIFVVPEPSEVVAFERVDIDMKTEPVHPAEFTKMMKRRMLDLNPDQHFSDKMIEAYGSFGAIYNEVSNFNRDGVIKRIIVPLSTGAGKTVSSKQYLALIAKLGISGLLVVSEVSVALEAVKEINELAGTNVAGAYYSVSEDNPDSNERCDLQDLPLIGLISHSMFTSRSHTGVDIDLLKYYDGKHRRCIIIDESINLVKSSSFGTEEIPDLMGILKRDQKLHNYVIQLSTVINTMQKESNAAVHYESHMKDMLESIVTGTRKVLLLIDSRQVNISKRMRGKKDSREIELKDTISLLERIAFVFGETFAITTEGKNKVMHRDIDLSGAFGSVVILDATSTINPSYTFHQKNSDDVQFMERIDVRNYCNVNINICHNKDLPQSKTAIYATPKKSKTLDKVVKQYLAAIEDILEPGDQLLVCTYKILVPLFKHLCPFDNVKFIHWGSSDARGSNEYKDFNKAMAIGFFRRPQHVYNGAVLAIKDYKFYVPTNGSIAKDAIQLKNHLLVDDLVQFFNRVRCRVSIDENGNCEPTELYLFTGGSESIKLLMRELIEKEMPNITSSEWTVQVDTELVASRKKNKLYRVAEEVVEWMLAVSYEYDVISQKNVQEYFGMRPGQMKRLKAEPHFQNLCEEEGIAAFKDGRSFMFHLPKNS